jgi:hypothetical protein
MVDAGLGLDDAEEGVFGRIEEVCEGRWEAIARMDRIRLRDAGSIEAGASSSASPATSTTTCA